MPKITEIYAFIAEDDGPDDEGIVAVKVDDQWFPLVAGDRKRVDSLRPLARGAAFERQKKVRLYRFTGTRELVEEISPP